MPRLAVVFFSRDLAQKAPQSCLPLLTPLLLQGMAWDAASRFTGCVQAVPLHGHSSPLVYMKMVLFSVCFFALYIRVHLPKLLHTAVLPLSIPIVHQTLFSYTFHRWWVTLSSASLSRCQTELASFFPSVQGKGHQVYFFENAGSAYHVAETLL